MRIVVLSAAVPACFVTSALGAASGDAAATATEGDGATPAAKAFDPSAMPEAGPAKSPLGYHYAELTPAQTSALRRGFKLPLDALAAAKSPADLKNAAVVTPLPDPNRPLLAVDPATESLANPFADQSTVSFRKDPLKALGALLGASGKPAAGSTAAAPSAAPSAASAEDDPFGATTATPAPTAQPAAAAESDEDPFGTDAEAPAAEEDDPFGAF